MRYLEDIRVFTSSKVEVIWSVGKRASALDSRRSVVTIDKNTRTLMIYVRRADQKSWQPPVELTEEICVLFNIPSERRHHVQFILGYSSDDMQDLEDTLIKAGFHILPDLGEEDKSTRPFCYPPQRFPAYS